MRPSGSFVTVLLGGALGLMYGAAGGLAQAPGAKAAGEAVYKQRCAGCHEQANPRIPPRSTLNQMPAVRILRALDFGAMMTVAYPMKRDEGKALPASLGTSAPAISFPAPAYCSDRSVTVSAKPKAAWNGWSPAANNARYQSAEAAGMSIDQVRALQH